MTRLEFLEKARQLAHQQIEESSCLTDGEFIEYQGRPDQELALYEKAFKILDDATYDIEYTVKELRE